MPTQDFIQRFTGSFKGIMRWHELDALWNTLKQQTDVERYIYAIGEQPPTAPVSQQEFTRFIDEIDALLHKEHDEDYCGIVYVDNADTPRYIKIFDPNNLGVSCGYSDTPPLPGWIISDVMPSDLNVAFPPPNNRRRWWKRIFA